jgi:RNA polymerase sigma-70 factor, ECF subfamily
VAASEVEIIGRILVGEKNLFKDLIRPYGRMVYLAAFSILRNEADAEDATQETMLNAYRHLGSFRAESKFSTWLVTIAVNEARHRLRK